MDRPLLDSNEPRHPWEQPAIYAANFAMGFLIIITVLFTILNNLPDPKPKEVAKKKKEPRTRDGRFTAEEVAKHNTAVRRKNENLLLGTRIIRAALSGTRIRAQDDAWLILDGKVYDVTEYVEEHPGGPAILKHVG